MAPLETIPGSGKRSPSGRSHGWTSASAAAVFLGLAFASANAATNVVTTLNDDEAGSLRQIIQASSPGDTIVFGVTGIVSVIKGELVISKNLSLVGPENTLVTLNALGKNRLLNVSRGCEALVSGVTLQGGKAPNGTNGVPNGGQATNGEPGQQGGAILNAGQLTLVGCVLISNAAGDGGNGVSFSSQWQGTPSAGGAGGDAGAIHNSGLLRMTNCVVSGNRAGDAGLSGSTTYSPPPAASGNGGGIFNAGTIIMDNVTLALNKTGNGGGASIGSSGAHGGSGGGLCSTGQVLATECVFQGNTTGNGGSGGAGKPNGGSGGHGGLGAGAFSRGPIYLVNCVFSNNVCGIGGNGGGASMTPAGSGGGGGQGGGLYTGNGTLIGCSFIGNRAGNGNTGGGSSFAGGPGGSGGAGGGIYCDLNLALTNCTIAGNTGGSGGQPGSSGMFQASGGPGGSGGGIYLGGSAQAVVACTIANNWAGTPGSGGGPAWTGEPGSGGGVCGRAAVLLNSIFALNAGSQPDVSGAFQSLGHNLFSATNGLEGTLLSSDLAGSTNSPLHPGLAPLANNGGRTPTIALQSDSPALDRGAPTGLAIDQCETTRPQGTAYDIGAFEYDYTVPILRGAPTQNGAGFYLEGHGLPGTTYLYQASTNFIDWMELSAVAAGTNGVSSCIAPEPLTGAKRFYRLVVGR